MIVFVAAYPFPASIPLYETLSLRLRVSPHYRLRTAGSAAPHGTPGYYVVILFNAWAVDVSDHLYFYHIDAGGLG